MSSSIPTQRDRLNWENHLMNILTLEELITVEIQVSRKGQYFWPLLQTAKLLKKKMKNLERAQHSAITSICPPKYTYNLTIFAKTILSYLYYNTDQSWNWVVYGTIYADQLLKKSILPSFSKNLGGTWKRGLKPYSRIQLTEKLKKHFFFLQEQFHANHAIIITSIL